MADKKKDNGLEGKINEGMPNLEEIATKLANMEENHKMDQILPSVMDAFINFPGVKYKDDRGVEHYKKNFTAVESNKIADAVFDKLVYHIHLRRYPNMTLEFLDQLKTMKDVDGNPQVESEVLRYLGITKGMLKKKLLDNRENLTPNHFNELVKAMLETHVEAVGKNLFAEFGNEHRDYVADFVNKYVKEKGLMGKEYKIKKSDTIHEILPKYQKIAMNFYRKDADDKPKEEKK